MSTKILLALLVGTVATAAVVVAGPGRGPMKMAGPGGGPCLADTDGDQVVTAAEWSALFTRLDADADGRLTGDELPRARHGMPPGALAGFFARQADEDGDGAVTAAEFEARIAALDSDGDGALSITELHAGRPGRGPGGPGFDGLPPFLSELDTDGDGKLGVAELQAQFAAADADGDGTLAGDELAPMFHHRRHH